VIALQRKQLLVIIRYTATPCHKHQPVPLWLVDYEFYNHALLFAGMTNANDSQLEYLNIYRLLYNESAVTLL
jgi:hypothetical protein